MAKRSDARRNYAALLNAAERVFAEHSPHAPLRLVAEAAGVGRGTLYRHFPDRSSLVAAIYAARLDRYETFAAAHADDPDVLFLVLRRSAEGQMAIPGLFSILSTGSASSEYIARLWRRTAEVFEMPLQASIQAGRVRPDVELSDLFLSVSMLYGVANSPTTVEHDEAVINRALDLIEHGLGTK